MKTSQEGIDLIKTFEGCKLHAYKCPAGVWTIGYGWTHGVKPGDVWSQEHADAMLIKGLEPYEATVAHVCPKATQSQFDAMVSLCYNIGQAAFAHHCSVPRLHNECCISTGDAFLKWNKGGGKVLPGLVRRRQAERKLYNRGV